MPSIGWPELIIIGFVLAVTVAGLTIGVFFCLSMSRALKSCANETRFMTPSSVWCLLIPLFSIVWNFFVTSRVSRSLQAEFQRRGIPAMHDCGKGIGLAYSVCSACSVIPFVGFVTAIVALVLWIVYWVKIVDLTRQLETHPGAAAVV